MSILRFKRNGAIHLTNTAVAALNLHRGDIGGAYSAMAPFIAQGRIPYQSNDRPRVDLPIGDAFTGHVSARIPRNLSRATMHEAAIIHLRAIVRHGQGGPQAPQGEPQAEPQGYVPTPEPQIVEPEPTPEPEPQVPEPKLSTSTADTIRARWAEYGRKIEFLRKFSADRKLTSLDSMRLNIEGRKLIAAGLPVDGLVANVCAHLGDDSLMQAGVDRFDWAAWGSRFAGDFDHGAFPAIVAAVKANVPVWIWGGAGIGKSAGVEKWAREQGFDYYELNLSGQTPNALTGRDRLHEFVESNFVKAYRDGGVWNGEEIDNADPRVLTLINNAIANGHFSNPVTGETIARHENFRIMVTANTNGRGAADGFIRNKIDRASIDRFAVGMFNISLDKRLESNIVGSLESDLLGQIDSGAISPLGF